MSDATSGDTEFQTIDDEYEDIDGTTHLLLLTPPIDSSTTVTKEMVHLQISTPLAASNSTTTTNEPKNSSLDELVEEYKRAREDLAISEKFTKLYEAKRRFHMEKQLVEYRRKKREEKMKKLAAIEKKKLGIQKLRIKEQQKKLEEKHNRMLRYQL